VYNRWMYDIPVDQWVIDGDEIDFNEHIFKVIETPGHSKGSTALYESPNLFVGDTLFYESVGRTDIPFSSFEELKDSILKLYELPDYVVVYPGHGKPTTIAHEKEHNPFVKKYFFNSLRISFVTDSFYFLK
jgi:hydroxyacylglutathione hydrolase